MNGNGTERIRDEIENYTDTVFAIIGFINFYRFDDSKKQMRSDVVAFQGRKFSPSSEKEKEVKSDANAAKYVTPDLGILLPTNSGVLGEVKKSFPSEEQHWFDDFRQLMTYDDDLLGWPSVTGSVASHDVALLLHQARGRAVCRFYEKHLGNEIQFRRPFCIVEFNRSNERQAYFFFRTAAGRLTDTSVNVKLENGVQVPMMALTRAYSEIKIYDSEPPLAYLLHLIWEHIINAKASENPKYAGLWKRQRISVELSVTEVVDELHEKFSFHQLHKHASDRQPKIPKQEWVQRAFDKLVKAGEAEWVDRGKGKLIAQFTRHDDVLTHFVEVCAVDEESAGQLGLFGQDH
jgi:hypothetical protein